MDATQLFTEAQRADAANPNSISNRLRVKFRPGQFMRVKVKGLSDEIRMRVPDDPQVARDFITGGGLERAMNSKFEEVQGFINTVYAGLTPEEKLAVMTMGVPGLGDATGLIADAGMYIRDPESRTLINGLMSTWGVAGATVAISPSQKRIAEKVAKNIEAWHGSPHKFDRFSMSQIGTGEGAQAYGHGLYAADDINVAKTYQPRSEAAEAVMMERYNQAIAAEDYEAAEIWENAMLHETPDEIIRRYQDPDYPDSIREKAQQIAGEMLDLPAQGGLYKLNINADPDTMLDWDAPLSEQPDNVLDALGYDRAEIPRLQQQLSDLQSQINPETFDGSALQSQIGAVEAKLRKWRETGGETYDRLARTPGFVGDAARGERLSGGYQSYPIVSEKLREAGIPGIKYLDGTSRAAGEGTRNYVVFDENLINILERNGEPIPRNVHKLADFDHSATMPTEIHQGYSPRKLQGKVRPTEDQARVENLRATYEPRSMIEVPKVSIFDMEGKPFVTSMADRTAAGGLLTGVNDVGFDSPIDLRGGQDFMIDPVNPGQVWASEQGPSQALLNSATWLKQEYGENPLYLPFRMSPTGGDYATMTAETMMKYARDNMEPGTLKEINRNIREVGRKFDFVDADGTKRKIDVTFPEFKGIENPESIEQLRDMTGNQRKLVLEVLDLKDIRNQGGLGITDARLAVSDPDQINARTLGLQNVGLIDPSRSLSQSTHPTYRAGVPGEPVGLLKEDISALQLLPEFMQERGLTDYWNIPSTDQYTLRLKPRMGIITEDILKGIEESLNQ